MINHLKISHIVLILFGCLLGIFINSINLVNLPIAFIILGIILLLYLSHSFLKYNRGHTNRESFNPLYESDDWMRMTGEERAKIAKEHNRRKNEELEEAFKKLEKLSNK